MQSNEQILEEILYLIAKISRNRKLLTKIVEICNYYLMFK